MIGKMRNHTTLRQYCHAFMHSCIHAFNQSFIHPFNQAFFYPFLLFAFVSMFPCSLFSQSLRGSVNEGVDFYKQKKFADAEIKFKKGLDANPNSFEANFNLGDAYYKQNR
ncbi:MAG: tetratricopeptide repeat protein, partial [Ignavibacteria bacterium]